MGGSRTLLCCSAAVTRDDPVRSTGMSSTRWYTLHVFVQRLSFVSSVWLSLSRTHSVHPSLLTIFVATLTIVCFLTPAGCVVPWFVVLMLPLLLLLSLLMRLLLYPNYSCRLQEGNGEDALASIAGF